MDVFRRTSKQIATIANGTALSNMIDLAGYTMVSLKMPAAWTAADLSFEVCDESNGTFVDLYDETATQVKIASAQMATLAGKGVSLDTILTYLAPWRFFKLKSSVAQGADRVFAIVLKA